MAQLDCTSPIPSASALSACTDICSSILDTNISPAWNRYDTTACNPEHLLFDSNICEYTDINGFAVEYRALIHPNDDYLYGEDPNATLSDPILTKVVFDPTEESSVINAWGISFDDTMQYMLSPKSIFVRDAAWIYANTPELSAKAVVPKAGDVITVLFNQKKYEITDVGDTGTNFNARKFVWEFILRPYRFSEQSIEHREVYSGMEIDPFETLTTDPTGGPVVLKNEFNDRFGDNDPVETESDTIDDYRDVINDPDKGAFGY